MNKYTHITSDIVIFITYIFIYAINNYLLNIDWKIINKLFYYAFFYILQIEMWFDGVLNLRKCQMVKKIF